jgi:hypothetical protein
MLNLFKGYPEYHPDQPRGEDGRWSGGGSARQRPKTYRVKRRGIDWSKQDTSIRLLQERGADNAGRAIKNVMSRLPEDHQAVLRNLPKKAVYDMAKYSRMGMLEIDPNRKDLTFTAGFYSPILGLVVGEGWTNNKWGFIEFENVERWATHEFGHAFDYNAIPGKPFAFSSALAGTIMSEYNGLSRSQRYYSEHYSADSLPKELFADVYAAMYGPQGGRERDFIGYSLTQQGVLRRFPRTVSAIRNWTSGTMPTSKCLDYFVKGYPEYNPDQSRGEDGRWSGGAGGISELRMDPASVRRRERYREKQRQQRATARPSPPRQEQEQRYIRVRAEPGTEKVMVAIKDTMARIPRNHYEVLKNLQITALYDMRRFASLNPKIDPERGYIAGFFNPGMGLVVGQGWSNQRFGFTPFDDINRIVIHESAHALDYYAIPGEEFAISHALAPVMLHEYALAPPAVRDYYAKAYEPSSIPQELFAEIYTATYGRPTSGKYLFNRSMTQQAVLTTFSGSVDALRSLG